MKYKLKYSPDAGDKLRELKKQITATYGNQVASIADIVLLSFSTRIGKISVSPINADNLFAIIKLFPVPEKQ